MSTNWRGINDVIKGFGRSQGEVIKAATEGITDAAGDLLDTSREEVPHDEGTLSGTGSITEPELTPTGPEVQVGYNTPYAARLHEHPEYHFQKGRKGKYLEDPLKRKEKDLVKYVIDYIKRVLKG